MHFTNQPKFTSCSIAIQHTTISIMLSSSTKRHTSKESTSQKDTQKTGKPDNAGDNAGDDADTTESYVTIAITIYIFRGNPDQYYNRHVLLYFTSPDLTNFQETVHAQLENSPRRSINLTNRCCGL